MLQKKVMNLGRIGSKPSKAELVVKQIAQPIKEWSEEDDAMLNILIDYFEHYHYPDNPMNKKTIGWLKSLKQRYTWKPSDEQMKAFDSAIHCYAGISPTNNREVYALEIMKEQLKKLKEEQL